MATSPGPAFPNPAASSSTLLAGATAIASTNSSNETYTANERVLCYHGPLIYEAKVMKVKVFDEGNTVTGAVGAHYLVHYKGWKQT